MVWYGGDVLQFSSPFLETEAKKRIVARQSENHGYTDYTDCQAFCPVVRIGSPSPSQQASVAPPLDPRGEKNSLVREGVGGPISDEVQALWYSM